MLCRASPDIAHRCSPLWLHLAPSCSPNRATQPLVSMESTEPDASAPMGLWEFANHIRIVTVMGTTVRLVAPTAPTEPGASDLMGLPSSGGHISGKNSGAAASREPKLGKEIGVVAVRVSGLIRTADQPGPRSSSRPTSVPSYGRYGC
jgi:hypothetical protein